MKSCKSAMLLYAVTDRAWEDKKPLTEQIKEAVEGGITCLQLREKDMSDSDFLKEAIDVKKLLENSDIPLIINDNVDIAVKSGAEGVHIGQSDMKLKDVREMVGDRMLVGVSVGTKERAIEAEKDGADYLGVGAVFPTSTKIDADNVPISELKKITESVNIPVVAIGGICEDNILKLKGTGIDGVAVVSAIFGSEDIPLSCKKLKKLSKEMIFNA